MWYMSYIQNHHTKLNRWVLLQKDLKPLQYNTLIQNDERCRQWSRTITRWERKVDPAESHRLVIMVDNIPLLISEIYKQIQKGKGMEGRPTRWDFSWGLGPDHCCVSATLKHDGIGSDIENISEGMSSLGKACYKKYTRRITSWLKKWNKVMSSWSKSNHNTRVNAIQLNLKGAAWTDLDCSVNPTSSQCRRTTERM